jgi:hypothetical protein
MRGYASHLLFLFVLSCEQAPIQQTKKERAALFLLSIVESGKWQGYLSRVFPHRILRLRHSFGDVAHARHSNPIFHPKFESLAKQDFQTLEAPPRRAGGMGVTEQRICEVANPIFYSSNRISAL